MAFLAGGWIPVPYHASGSGDWWIALLVILGFAVAVTVAMVLGNRPAQVRTTFEQPEKPSLPKAA